MSTTPTHPASKKPWYLRPWVWIVAGAIVICAIIGPFLDTDSDKPDTNATPTTTTAPAKTKNAESPKADAAKSAAPSTQTASKSEPKEDLVLAWWVQGHGSAVQQYAKTLKSMETAINNGDSATLLGQCSQVIEWTSFGGDADSIEGIQDIDADLDNTLGEARAHFTDVAKGCKDVFDKGEATKAQQLGNDIVAADYAFSEVKAGTYDRYLGLKK